MSNCINCGQDLPDGNCPVCSRNMDPDILAAVLSLKERARQHPNYGKRRRPARQESKERVSDKWWNRD